MISFRVFALAMSGAAFGHLLVLGNVLFCIGGDKGLPASQSACAIAMFAALSLASAAVFATYVTAAAERLIATYPYRKPSQVNHEAP